MIKTTRAVGIVAITFGLIASIFAFIHIMWPMIAVVAGFLGFLFSSVYIFLNARYSVNTKTFNPGTIGLLLSSVPVIFFIIIVLSSR